MGSGVGPENIIIGRWVDMGVFMLTQIEIKNVAIIDNISIELGKGLNILTGETGAGKSIIIDSITAVLGSRGSKDIIRTGTDKASIQAVFHVDYEKLGDILEGIGVDAEEDGTLILSREFNISGRNTCRVNGKLVTVSALKEIGERIIDFHGQHDNQSLIKVENHIEFLDSFGDENIKDLIQKYSELLADYKTLKSKIKQLSGGADEREKKIDILKYQIDEIKQSGLKIGEEEELNKKRDILVNSEKILSSLSYAYQILYSGDNIKTPVFDNLNQAVSELNKISEFNDRYMQLTNRLEDICYQIEDITHELREERDNIEFNPVLLDKIEERISLIFKLKRKYGNSIKEILEYCSGLEIELEEIIKSEEIVARLIDQMEKIELKLFEIAESIHSERVSAAKTLETKIGNELNDLDMKKAQFKVDIEFDKEFEIKKERKFYENGLDKVEFLISPNVGEPLKPLSKIASGGEMSRIMLAIKTILANVDKIPTMVFDEIDSGVSGKASTRIGEKLSFISKNHQVICVTHLAQIACMADNHYLIEKKSDSQSTRTIVKKLKGDQIINEVARILGGITISDITRKHAQEMLNTAEDFKKY
jgi:DNA repair protein RecN (Recombination protein N)